MADSLLEYKNSGFKKNFKTQKIYNALKMILLRLDIPFNTKMLPDTPTNISSRSLNFMFQNSYFKKLPLFITHSLNFELSKNRDYGFITDHQHPSTYPPLSFNHSLCFRPKLSLP